MSNEEQKIHWTPAAVHALVDGDIENFWAAATPGGIEAQEAAGQRTLVASEMLPKEGTIKGPFHDPERNYQAAWQALGVVFGKEVDDLFVEAKLPPGWKMVPESHSMWSRLEDEQGRERAAIFYKAAFYDRNAHLSPTSRFTYRTWYAPTPDQPEDYNSPDEHKQVCAVVLDTGKVVFHTMQRERKDWNGQSRQFQECTTWLNERYPNWRDPFAYWDEPAEKVA